MRVMSLLRSCLAGHGGSQGRQSRGLWRRGAAADAAGKPRQQRRALRMERGGAGVGRVQSRAATCSCAGDCWEASRGPHPQRPGRRCAPCLQAGRRCARPQLRACAGSRSACASMHAVFPYDIRLPGRKVLLHCHSGASAARANLQRPDHSLQEGAGMPSISAHLEMLTCASISPGMHMATLTSLGGTRAPRAVGGAL